MAWNYQTRLIKQLVWKDLVGLMVFNATFNNISVLSWRSVLLVDETGWPGENHKLYHIMLYTSPWSRFELKSVVIGNDRIGSCKSNYHTNSTTTFPSIMSITHTIKWMWNSPSMHLNNTLYFLSIRNIWASLSLLSKFSLFYIMILMKSITFFGYLWLL